MTTIYKTFQFDAAHKLPKVPAGHKCGSLHGHTYRLIVFLSGEPDPATGWLIDYADIKAAVEPILQQLDHRYLNDIYGLDNPTTEVLCRWLWLRLKPILPMLSEIEVKESEGTGCVYSGPSLVEVE